MGDIQVIENQLNSQLKGEQIKFDRLKIEETAKKEKLEEESRTELARFFEVCEFEQEIQNIECNDVDEQARLIEENNRLADEIENRVKELDEQIELHP